MRSDTKKKGTAKAVPFMSVSAGVGLGIADRVALAVKVVEFARGNPDVAGKRAGRDAAVEHQFAGCIVDVGNAGRGGRIVGRTVNALAGGEEMQRADMRTDTLGDYNGIVGAGTNNGTGRNDVCIAETDHIHLKLHFLFLLETYEYHAYSNV